MEREFAGNSTQSGVPIPGRFVYLSGMVFQFENKTPFLEGECHVAENATVVGNVVLGSQSSIWFGAVLRGDIEPIAIGERSNIQDNSVAHTSLGKPVVVGRGTTVTVELPCAEEN